MASAGRGGRRPDGRKGQAPPKRGSKPTRPDAPRGAGKAKAPAKSAGGGAARRGGDQRRSPAKKTTSPGGTDASGRHERPRGLGGTQVEGRQAVRELLLAGRRKVKEIYLSNEVDRSDVVEDILGLAAELRVRVHEVSRTKLDHLSHTEAPQGVVAIAQQLPSEELRVLCRPPGGANPFLLAVDGVTDPGNLGALLRIAECAGVTGVVLPRHRAVHVTPTVTKAAAGAVEYLPMSLVGGIPSAIEEMKAAGVWVVGLDMAGPIPVHDLDLSGDGVCLVMGSEGRGLSRLVRERCDLLAAIPLHGRLASLNVSAAGAIACYEVARRRSG